MPKPQNQTKPKQISISQRYGGKPGKTLGNDNGGDVRDKSRVSTINLYKVRVITSAI